MNKELLTTKAAEWAKFIELSRYLHEPTLIANNTRQMYEVAARDGHLITEFVDQLSLRDCQAILALGKPLFQTIYDIPVFEEQERKRLAAEHARQHKLELERTKMERLKQVEKEKERKRAKLAQELGLKPEALAKLV